MNHSTSQTQRIKQHLSTSYLFKKLPENIVIHFAEKAQLKHADKGEILFLQGDEVEWFYFMVDGWVKLFRQTVEGEEVVIDILNANNMFGENFIFSGENYNYGAEIASEATYIKLPTSLLKFYLAKEHQISFNMLENMSQQQQIQSREIEHLNIQNAPQRIGCYLLKICPHELKNPIKLQLPYDKTLIAAKLGMKPETFSRALARLKKDLSLTIDRSLVTIPSHENLAEYVCNACSQTIACN